LACAILTCSVRSNINGPYAAVIPLFITQILNNVSPTINGDGETSRDFTFVSNVVQANIKALEASIEKSEVFNCACNERITLNQLVHEIKAYLNSDVEVVYGNERPGDVRHSQADITKAVQMLGYQPEVRFREGLLHTIDYFKNRLK